VKAIAIWLALSGVAWADPAPELVVVGVYRPVELSGRTLNAPREVYLAERNGATPTLPGLVGRELTVRRRVPVPAVLPLGEVPAKPAAPAEAVAPARPAPVPTRDIEVTVGTLRVVAVREGVVVAEVVADRLTAPAEPKKAKGRKAPPKVEADAPAATEMPVVMAGDVVRFDPPPAAPPAPPPPGVIPEETHRLKQERAELEAELKRRNAPPPAPYQRPDPRWNL
jgi:hypothetical protein